MPTTLDAIRTDLQWTEQEIDKCAGDIQKKYMHTELKELVDWVTGDEDMPESRMIEIVNDYQAWNELGVPESAYDELLGELDDLFDLINTADEYRYDIQCELDALPY